MKKQKKVIIIVILIFINYNSFSQYLNSKKGLEFEIEYQKQAVHLPIKTENIACLISSKFGKRYHPIHGRNHLHNGVDIAINYKDVFAVILGKVISVGENKNSGKYVIIQHLNNIVTGYCHLSSINVLANQIVLAGNKIGVSGNSGNSTGPHLHFTLKYNGEYIDPLKFLIEIERKNKL